MGFRVQGFRVLWDLAFRVQGLGFTRFLLQRILSATLIRKR